MVAFFCFRGLFFEKSEKKIKIFKFFFHPYNRLRKWDENLAYYFMILKNM